MLAAPAADTETVLAGPAVPGNLPAAEGEEDTPPFATGIVYYDANGDHLHNVGDLLAIVGHLRREGSSSTFDPLDPDSNGWVDTNGDGLVTLDDLLRSVQKLRADGPGPVSGPEPSQTISAVRAFPMTLTVTTGSVSFVPAIVDLRGGALTYAVAGQPQNGELTSNGATFTYHVTGSGAGDLFAITGTNSAGESATSIVTLEFAFGSGLIALPDRIVTAPDTPVSFNPLANDRHGSGVAFGIESHTQTANGTLTHAGGGNFDYVPHVAFVGTDAFSYTIKDDNGALASATVTIIVRANSAPVPTNPTITTRQDTPSAPFVLATDPEGDALNVTFGPSPNATIERLESGQWRAIPNVGFHGTTQITYTATDAFGASVEGVLTLNVQFARFTTAGVPRGEVVFVLAELSPGGAAPAPPRFQDVPEGHPDFASVQEADQDGFFGDSFAVGQFFDPNRPVTIAEMADILVQAYDLQGPDFLSAAQLAGVLLPGEQNRLAEHVSERRFWEMIAAARHPNGRSLSESELDTLARQLAAQFGTTY